MPDLCPMCQKQTLDQKTGLFTFNPPRTIPGGPILVDNATWEECSSCKEKIIGDELEKAIREEARIRNR